MGERWRVRDEAEGRIADAYESASSPPIARMASLRRERPGRVFTTTKTSRPGYSEGQMLSEEEAAGATCLESLGLGR